MEKPHGISPVIVRIGRLFNSIEHIIYIVLGLLLAASALLALAGAARLLLEGLGDWQGTETVFAIMDRLLFVLMLVEILYTVRVSMQSGTLLSEPFLVVGLIACIRRILVLSLETSNLTQLDKWTPQSAGLFAAAMTELGVLAGLLVVMVGAITYIRRMRDT